MTIGLIGTGLLGTALTRLLAKAGHHVIISFSRNPQKMEGLAQELATHNVQIGTPAEAVSQSEIVLLSVHLAVLDVALQQMGDLRGKLLIDTTNPVDIKLPAGVNGSQEIARRLPGARLVKVFNTLMYDLLIPLSFQEPPTVMPLAGDDKSDKATVAQLVRDIGFVPLDTGALSGAGWQEPGGPFFNRVLTPEKAEALFRQL